MPTEIEQLRSLNPTLADEAVALGRKLAEYGVRLKIAVPDRAGEVPGWNAQPIAPGPPPLDLLTAQPPPGEVSKDQIASGVRAALTAVGAVLATLGVAKPQIFLTLGAHVDTIAMVIGFALPFAVRVQSWLASKKQARHKAQQVAVALSLPADHADLLSSADVRDLTAARVDAAKQMVQSSPRK